MRILFLGSGEFAIPTLDSIRYDGHEIVTVVSQPDKVRGRGSEPTPTPVKAAALEYGFPIITPVDVNAADVVAQIKSLNADLAYVAAFGQKIGTTLLNAFPVGIINLHGSLLPKLRGAAPIQWSVINGDENAGVTIFRLVEKMDAGPILMQRRTAIGFDETADELHERLSRIGCDALRATLEALQENPALPGEPQDHSLATIAPKLKKTDGLIRFDQDVKTTAHRICGLWSWPGASCRFVSADSKRDEIVTLARARPYEGLRKKAASLDDLGKITEMLAVQLTDAELEILEIKPAGGKLMNWRDYVNGRRVKAGDKFVPIEPHHA